MLNVAPGSIKVGNAAGVASPGYAVTDFATGFNTFPPYGPGPVGLAFDSQGNLYSTGYLGGNLYKFPPTGNTFESSVLSNVGYRVTGLAFDKGGRLFLARQGEGDIAELDPSTGSIIGTVASGICGPNAVAVDPLTNDLFISSCGTVQRLHGYQGQPVTPTLYTSNVAVDGLTFAPDGTLYGAGGGPIYRITGTSDVAPGTPTVLANVPRGDGIALLAPQPGRPITQLVVNTNNTNGFIYDGEIDLVDFSSSPATITPIVTGGNRGDFVAVGPDKCLYATQSDEIEKVTAADGSCPFIPTGVGTPRPNPPQHVTNIGTAAGNVLVAWQAPQPDGAVIDHYEVQQLALDGTPIRFIRTVSATAPLEALIGSLNLCSYYFYGVLAVGADGQRSNLTQATTRAFTQASPASPPPTVTILIQGVNSHDRASTFNPLTVYDYCTSLDGANPNDIGTTYPPALADMQSYWDQDGEPAHQPAYGAGNRLIDSLASHGGIVLPFSYKGATLTGNPTAPTFTFHAYTGSDVANTFPQVAAKTLDDEITSINKVWPSTKIVVVGHSNGGAIAELWWIFYGSQNAHGVVQAFSLDSPLNGVANADCVNGNPICSFLGVGSALGITYQAVWAGQAQLDPGYVALQARSPLFTPVGTVGDPVYDPPDQGAAHNPAGIKQIGIISQIWWSEPGCMNSGFDLSSSACIPVGNYFIDPCGPLNDGTPPLFGVPGSFWLHGVVENCPGVIAKIMTYAG